MSPSETAHDRTLVRDSKPIGMRKAAISKEFTRPVFTQFRGGLCLRFAPIVREIRSRAAPSTSRGTTPSPSMATLSRSRSDIHVFIEPASTVALSFVDSIRLLLRDALASDILSYARPAGVSRRRKVLECNVDAFESVVKLLLEGQGFWVRNSYKVSLTKEEKVSIGRPSCPRWELDVLGYRPKDNSVVVVECKSYLDSPGVSRKGFSGLQDRATERYKLFNEEHLRLTVLSALARQLTEEGLCQSEPRIKLGLAAGKVASSIDRDWLRNHFQEMGWLLYDDERIRTDLEKLAGSMYENDPVLITTKLLLRKAL